MLRSSYRTGAASGAIVSIAGSLLLLRVGPASSALLPMASGLLIGFGMGMNNNTYIVAVQSGSGWSQRGIATSTIIFTRILGQAIGAAMFGGILNARLAGTAGGGDLVNRMLEPALRGSIPPASLPPLIATFDAALHTVFAIMLALNFVVLVVGLLLPTGHRLALGNADD